MTIKETKEYCIDVESHATYVEHYSNSEMNQYVFAYTIVIHNVGTQAAKLLTRQWVIVDSDEKTQEVYGEGVIGEKPYLKPSEKFEYTSSVMIETPVGSMRGSYEMETDNGDIFTVKIAAFTLATPHILN